MTNHSFGHIMEHNSSFEHTWTSGERLEGLGERRIIPEPPPEIQITPNSMTTTEYFKLSFCTLCDKSYLLKGLAMLHSLDQRYKSPFTLYWLCLDNETYNKLTELNLQNVELIPLEDLENADPHLLTAKDNPPSQYGDKYANYCWLLAPYFINWLLKNKLEENDYLMYIDSDILFYESPMQIMAEVYGYSAGFHSHRFSGELNENSNVGWFNVGIVVFRNNRIGKEMTGRWTGWMLDINHEYYEKYGTCGDQGYLMLLYRFYKEEIRVFDEDVQYTHLAPWCTHVPPDSKNIGWVHFSHFVLLEDDWRDSLHGEWNPALLPHMRMIYEDYYRLLIILKQSYGIN